MNAYLEKINKELKVQEWEHQIKRNVLSAFPQEIDLENMHVANKMFRHTDLVTLTVNGDPATLMGRLKPLPLFKYSGAWGQIDPQITRELLLDDPVRHQMWMLDARVYDIGNWYIDHWWLDFRERETLIWHTDLAGYVCQIKMEIEKPIFHWYYEGKVDRSGHEYDRELKSKCEIPHYTTWVHGDNKYAGLPCPSETSVFWEGGAELYIEAE